VPLCLARSLITGPCPCFKLFLCTLDFRCRPHARTVQSNVSSLATSATVRIILMGCRVQKCLISNYCACMHTLARVRGACGRAFSGRVYIYIFDSNSAFSRSPTTSPPLAGSPGWDSRQLDISDHITHVDSNHVSPTTIVSFIVYSMFTTRNIID